jgi:mannose-1-phosphate guanylyltransferase
MSSPLKGFKALLLAGGMGTRLKPLTDSIPKCLVSIGGKPLLAYWLESLSKAGVERILINTHYLSEQVIAFCRQSQYSPLLDLIHEPALLGTAGTIRANRRYFNNKIFLAHADNFTLFDVDAFFSAHQNRAARCEATMMTFTTDAPSSCGIVEIDKEGVLVNFHEKVANPPGNQANAAVFILEPSSLSWLDQNPNATDFCKEIVPLGLHKIQTYHNNIYHRDIGTIESFNQANLDFKKLVKTQINHEDICNGSLRL